MRSQRIPLLEKGEIATEVIEGTGFDRVTVTCLSGAGTFFTVDGSDPEAFGAGRSYMITSGQGRTIKIPTTNRLTFKVVSDTSGPVGYVFIEVE